MDCNQIRDLILTDILDNEADAVLSEEVGRHLANCATCRNFAKDLQKTVKTPFQDLAAIKPPDSVWQKISERLEAKKLSSPRFVWAWVKMPAFGFAFAAILVLMVSIITRTDNFDKNDVNVFLTEQVEFLAELESDYEIYNNNSTDTLGTVIEEYFL